MSRSALHGVARSRLVQLALVVLVLVAAWETASRIHQSRRRTATLRAVELAEREYRTAVASYMAGSGWFPARSFHQDPGLDDSINRYYASVLTLLEEAPISSERDGRDVLRLVTGGHDDTYYLAIVVRLGAQTHRVSRKSFCRWGGVKSHDVEVDAVGIERFLRSLQKAGLWSPERVMPPRATALTTGPWLVETLRNGSYGLLELANASQTDWTTIQSAFLDLAGIEDFNAGIQRCREAGRPLTGVSAEYPDAARSKGVAGEVVVQFLVSTEGGVSGLEILRESPEGHEFGTAALEAARKLRFPPSQQSFYCTQVFSFNPGRFQSETEGKPGEYASTVRVEPGGLACHGPGTE